MSKQRNAGLAREKDPDADFLGLFLLILQFHQEPQVKGISNHVAGKANALVVPDIVTGMFCSSRLFGCWRIGCRFGLGGAVPIVLTARSSRSKTCGYSTHISCVKY